MTSPVEAGPEGSAGARPRVRALDAFPTEHDGRQVVGLRDPAAFTDGVALLPLPLLEVVSLFDGAHTLGDIVEAIRARRGQGPTLAQVAALAEGLDAAGFLDSPAFAERRRAVEEAFRQVPTRPAVHAGRAYAGDAGALRSQIDGFFAYPNGPGPLPARAGRLRRSVNRDAHYAFRKRRVNPKALACQCYPSVRPGSA